LSEGSDERGVTVATSSSEILSASLAGARRPSSIFASSATGFRRVLTRNCVVLLPAAMSGVEAGSYRPATRNRLPWSAPQSLLPDPTKMRARWWIGRGAGSGCV